MTDLTRQTQLNRDRATLSDPTSVQQVMKIGEKYAALHRALKGMKGYEDEYYKAFEVMIEAYHVAGTELDKAGVREVGDRYSEGISTLADLGITSKQALEYRSIAKLPRTEIEAYVESKRKESEQVTKKAILDLAEAYKSVKQKAREKAEAAQVTALNFCLKAKDLIEHLRDFPDTDAREGVPKDFFDTMKRLGEILDELNKATM